MFSQAQFATGPTPVSVVIGDFNRDGRLDLAVVNADSTNGNTVSILLGKPDGTFAPKVDYVTGAAPWSVVTADFNADGKLDLAIANSNANTISLLTGKGDGTFQDHIDLPVGQNPRSVAQGDFNGDGKTDLVVANQTDNTVSVLLGHGDGTFGLHLDYPSGSGPSSVTTGDFNSDGRLDLAVATSGTFSVTTLQGNGDGTFQSPVDHSISSPYNPVSIVAADLNGDGILDLAVAATRSGVGPEDEVSVLLANGDGTFQNPSNYACVRFVSSIVAADFNGDGKLDLVVGSSYGDPQSLSVLIGNGDGTLQSHRDYSAGFAPISVAVGDFNRDGKLDLVTANINDNNVAVLLGAGDGTFQPRSDYTIGNSSQGIVTADFNNDGKLDLATADCGANSVSVLLGNTDGTFQSRSTYSTGACPVAVAEGDFNSDGRIDLAVANQNDSTLSILLGNGDGTFQAHTDYALPYGAIAIAVADFNRDNRSDVVVLAVNVGVFSILLGNGNGTFQPHADYDAGTGIGPSALAVGDFNADGTPDLAITDSAYSGTMSILLGNGDGSFRFASPRTYTLPFTPNSVAVGDFNRDGKLDLAVAQGTSQGAVSILLGVGDGSFQAPSQYQTNHYPGSVATADFDGDGILDLAVGGSSTSILLGNGDGTFQTHMDHVGGAYALTTGDFDGDGRMDLAAATLSSFVSVFLNKPAANPASRPPSITSISPTSATQGQTLPNFTVNGNNFDPAAALSFGGTGITVNSYGSHAATQIVTSITIARIAATGPYDVTVTNPDSQHVTLPGAFTVAALPPPPTGTINVTTNTAGATFTLTGPATLSGTGTSATFSNAPVGAYTITFGAVAGDIAPAQQTQTLTTGGALTFTGTYNPAPPPPPPSITSISPLSGNRGQSLSVTVTGANFQTGATLSFSGTGVTVPPLTGTCVSATDTNCISPTAIHATISVLANAPVELKNIFVTNPGGQVSNALSGFRVDTEFLIFSGTPDEAADEPSIAIDPRSNPADPLHTHVVAGFNIRKKIPGTNPGQYTFEACGWRESTDGGVSWGKPGTIIFPNAFQPREDPWVRFSSDGTKLFYSCLGSKVGTNFFAIFFAVSKTGRATDLQPANTMSLFSYLVLCRGFGQCPDEPSFEVTKKPDGKDRLVACWVETNNRKQSLLREAYSDNGGASWSTPQTLASPKASGCRIGTIGDIGQLASIAVTWLDGQVDTLFFRTSPDGITFAPASPLGHSAAPLLDNGSTTDIVNSKANASLSFASEINGLASNWQLRQQTLISTVFTGNLVYNSQGTALDGLTIETFLPSAGACGAVVGAYAVTDRSDPTNKLFRFATWRRMAPNLPIFLSTFDLTSKDAIKDPEFKYPRIGEYTAIDCADHKSFAAWTDLRNHKPEIWGAKVPLQ